MSHRCRSEAECTGLRDGPVVQEGDGRDHSVALSLSATPQFWPGQNLDIFHCSVCLPVLLTLMLGWDESKICCFLVVQSPFPLSSDNCYLIVIKVLNNTKVVVISGNNSWSVFWQSW